MNNTIFSIVVATKDRSLHITHFLSSLKKAGILQRKDTEVIIIDNNSSDNSTQTICSRYKVLYALEKQIGKSYALNKGIFLACGKYIVFTDDDAEIRDKHWLDLLYLPFKNNSRLGYVSGNVIAKSQETYAQRVWERKGGLSKGKSAKYFDSSYLQHFDFLPWPLTKICAGANCMIPKQLLKDCGYMNTLFGPGAMIPHGESLLIGYEIIKRGYELYYEPRAKVYHSHPKKVSTLMHKLFIYGLGDTALHTHIFLKYHDFRSLIWAFGGHQFYVFKNLIKSFFGVYPLPPYLTFISFLGSCIGPIFFIYKWIVT